MNGLRLSRMPVMGGFGSKGVFGGLGQQQQPAPTPAQQPAPAPQPAPAQQQVLVPGVPAVPVPAPVSRETVVVKEGPTTSTLVLLGLIALGIGIFAAASGGK